MDTTSHRIRPEGVRETLLDVASVLAVALIALVFLVVTNPRIGRALDTVLRPTQTHSIHVATQPGQRP